MEARTFRHHRTALLLGALARLAPDEAATVLGSLRFTVSIGKEEARTPAGQAALLTAVNVLARSAGSIALEVPSVRLILPRLPWQGSLDTAAASIAQWAGATLVESEIDFAGVHVGASSTTDRVLAAGEGWTARVDHRDAQFDELPLTLGAVAAAHLASARAFHIGLEARLGLPASTRTPITLSLWHEGTPPRRPRLAIDDVTLVGAGAVAQAMLWAFALSDARIEGDLILFDPQTIDATNLNRHLLAGMDHVGTPKAAIAADFIRPFAPTVHPRIERFVAPDAIVDRIVSTVDNDETRYQIQGAFPRRVFHAATSGESVAAAVLDFSDGACLGCLFPRPQRSEAARLADETGIPIDRLVRVLAENGSITDDLLEPLAARMGVAIGALAYLRGRTFREAYARELCGRLPIGIGVGAPAATIAYASGLAGTALAAELVKTRDPELNAGRLRNYLQLSASAPGDSWIVFRQKQADCPLMCGSPALQQLVRTLWSEGAKA